MSDSLAEWIRTANRVIVQEGNADAVDDYFTGDYVVHATGQDLTGGPSFVKRWIEKVHGAFADLDVTVHVLVESDDRVAWERTLTGTQTGSFQGFPASDRRIVWRDMVVSRLEGGRIAEEWVVGDLAEQLLRARKR